MNHTDFWAAANIVREKAIAAAKAWDLNAAKTLRALADEFEAMGDAAEVQYLADKAEHESHKYDGYDNYSDVEF